MLNMLSIKIMPFKVPMLVHAEPSQYQTESYFDIPIEKLDSNTLEQLCEEFTENVFRKAKRIRPRKLKEYTGEERRSSMKKKKS